MDSPPVLFEIGSELGESYIAAMQLAGDYAYAGRDVVVDKVLEILGAQAEHEVDRARRGPRDEPFAGGGSGAPAQAVRLPQPRLRPADRRCAVPRAPRRGWPVATCTIRTRTEGRASGPQSFFGLSFPETAATRARREREPPCRAMTER